MIPDELVAEFFRERQTTQVIGSRTQIVPVEEVHYYDIRSIPGDSFVEILHGQKFIFIDEVATEYALHLFDLTFTSIKNLGTLRDVAKGLKNKEFARTLYAIGDPTEAYILSVVEDSPAVNFADSRSVLTEAVDEARRNRFIDDYLSFTVEHELAHLALGSSIDLSAEYNSLCSDVLCTDQGLFDLGRLGDAVAIVIQTGMNPETIDVFKKFATSDEYPKYESMSREDLLANEDFVEEIACDLLAVNHLFGDCETCDAVELAEHIMLSAFVAFLSRIRLLEMAVVEHLRDALVDADLSMPPHAILEALDTRGEEYTERGKDRYKLVQLFRVRIRTLSRFMEDLIPSNGSAYENLESSLDELTVRLMGVIGLLTGPIESWNHKLQATAYLAAKEFRRNRREAGFTEHEIATLTKEEFLILNAICPSH